MYLKEIRIRNFRSIVKADVALNDMSIFVGNNDVGKSNILKSLNLFFNNETDYAKPLNFYEDYSKYTPIRKKKAEEIIVELILSAPKNYKGSKDIRWKRVWRKSGFHKDGEEIVFADETKFPRKSKLYSWLENVRFMYIPAIRGTTYFEILLAKLHDSLVETIEDELRTAGDDFISKIETNTAGMINEISARLNIKSQIRFPSNLQTLFKTLDFSTAEGTFDISLSNRGDGIKTRHIPAILKFISDQLNINRIKGSPNVSMIWGYEEPENNLEMLATYKLAEQFVEYSDRIQLLLTTHSPGFYSLGAKHPDFIITYKVSRQANKEAIVAPIQSNSVLDDEMGIMPIIAPYIREKIDEIEKLNGTLIEYRKEIEGLQSNILYVEGYDEVRIFNRVITLLKLNLVPKATGLGCGGVKNQIMSWSWVSGISKFRAIALFDNDESGNKELKKLESEKQFIDASLQKRVKAMKYKVPIHLQKIKSNIPTFPIELEEMYPANIWRHAEKKEWLVKRDMTELNSFVKLDSPEQNINQKIRSYQLSSDEELYIFNKVPDPHKDKLSKYIAMQDDDHILIALKPIIEQVNKYFIPFLN